MVTSSNGLEIMDWDEKAQTNKQTNEQTIRSTYTHITRAIIRKRMYIFITINPIIPMGTVALCLSFTFL